MDLLNTTNKIIDLSEPSLGSHDVQGKGSDDFRQVLAAEQQGAKLGEKTAKLDKDEQVAANDGEVNANLEAEQAEAALSEGEIDSEQQMAKAAKHTLDFLAHLQRSQAQLSDKPLKEGEELPLSEFESGDMALNLSSDYSQLPDLAMLAQEYENALDNDAPAVANKAAWFDDLSGSDEMASEDLSQLDIALDAELSLHGRMASGEALTDSADEAALSAARFMTASSEIKAAQSTEANSNELNDDALLLNARQSQNLHGAMGNKASVEGQAGSVDGASDTANTAINMAGARDGAQGKQSADLGAAMSMSELENIEGEAAEVEESLNKLASEPLAEKAALLGAKASEKDSGPVRLSQVENKLAASASAQIEANSVSSGHEQGDAKQSGEQARSDAFSQAANLNAQPLNTEHSEADSNIDGLAATGQTRATASPSVTANVQQAQQINQAQQQGFNERLSLNQNMASEELNQRVQFMLGHGLQRAEIRLDPAELGSMQIRLQINNDQASVQIQVQNPQAREALEQSLPRLREMLAQQGIELGQTQVGQQQSRGGNEQQAQQSQEWNLAEGDGFDGDFADDGVEFSHTVSLEPNDDRIDFYA